MKYKTLEFPDRLEWLSWRHLGIGSSDASVVMDVSRFKSRGELRAEKAKPFSGKDEASDFIKNRGNQIEVLVRTILEDKHVTEYKPTNIESVDFPFMRASLDGYSAGTDTLIEIKLLSVFNPEKPNTGAPGYKKWEEARRGIVPEEYYPQVMHQLMISGAKRCFFVGLKDVKGSKVLEDNLAIVEVLPDETYFKVLAAKEFEFWWQVRGL